jgi:uncharacterized membrane protein YgcG
MIKYLPFGAGLLGLMAVVAAAALFMGHDGTATAQNFFNPCGSLSLSSTAANTPADIKGNFGIGLDPATCGRFASAQDRPGEWNSAGLITFTPPGWNVGKDADIPDGTKVGTFKSEAVLGILDNGCSTVLNVNFDLLDATIDQTNVVAAKPPGEKDRLSPIAATENGVPAGALHWPDYLSKLATDDRYGMDLSKLRARFIGVNNKDVVGTTVILNFLVFEPGAKVSNKIQLDPALGYPAVTVLQDPSAIASFQDPVSDFCAPLWTESSLSGTAGGATFRGNPGDGIYNFVTYIVPAPDADNDGIENSLDPCPYTANTSGWDPRAPLVKGQTVGDPDIDGIPSDCDPDPNVQSLHNAGSGASRHDEDDDRWQNRGDNCSIVANQDQADADGDAIGDACDQNINTVAPETVDGRHAAVCLVSKVTIGNGGADPGDPTTKQPCGADPIGGGGGGGNQTPAPGNQPGGGGSGSGTGSGSGGSSGGGGVGSGNVGTGIGSLAPTGTSIPAWAMMLAALGLIGLLTGFGMMGSRIWRRR